MISFLISMSGPKDIPTLQFDLDRQIVGKAWRHLPERKMYIVQLPEGLGLDNDVGIFWETTIVKSRLDDAFDDR
jgi:hypothetical protein